MLTASETNKTQAVSAIWPSFPNEVQGEKATLRISTWGITGRPIKSSFLSAVPRRQIHPHPSTTKSKITSSEKPSLTRQTDLVTCVLNAHCCLLRILLAYLAQRIVTCFCTSLPYYAIKFVEKKQTSFVFYTDWMTEWVNKWMWQTWVLVNSQG